MYPELIHRYLFYTVMLNFRINLKIINIKTEKQIALNKFPPFPRHRHKLCRYLVLYSGLTRTCSMSQRHWVRSSVSGYVNDQLQEADTTMILIRLGAHDMQHISPMCGTLLVYVTCDWQAAEILFIKVPELDSNPWCCIRYSGLLATISGAAPVDGVCGDLILA